MAVDWLRYANQGATRNQELSPKLLSALGFLSDLGVTMEVFSGGQPGKGTSKRRTGSTRHDHGNSADVFFHKDGRRLDWNNPRDLPIFAEIVKRGRAAGITGFGAGDGYMQPGSMHIGFGNPGVWGKGGKGANAAKWLRAAFNGAPHGPAPDAIPSNETFNMAGMSREGALNDKAREYLAPIITAAYRDNVRALDTPGGIMPPNRNPPLPPFPGVPVGEVARAPLDDIQQPDLDTLLSFSPTRPEPPDPFTSMGQAHQTTIAGRPEFPGQLPASDTAQLAAQYGQYRTPTNYTNVRTAMQAAPELPPTETVKDFPVASIAPTDVGGAFGSISPGMGMTPEQADAISRLTSGGEKKNGWERMADVMGSVEFMPAARVSGGMGDANQTGNALMAALASPTMADVLLAKRLGRRG